MPAPFRADHVGSLLRPHELHDLREQVRLGKAPAKKLKELEDRLIREVVKLQEDLGLQSVTDGEFRRDWWHIDFLSGFDGIELHHEEDPYHGIQFKGAEAKPPTMFVTRKLRRSKPSMVPHFEFLKRTVTRGVPKFTMPSPAMLHARGDRASIRKTYPNADNFWADLTQCYREEIADLVKAGCRYIQLDEVAIALLCDPAIRKQVEAAGQRPDALVDLYIDAINDAIGGAPSDVEQPFADRHAGELRRRVAVELALQVLAVLLRRPEADLQLPRDVLAGSPFAFRRSTGSLCSDAPSSSWPLSTQC